MSERIDKLKEAVQTMHNCTATHVQSAPVVELMQQQTVWEGVVEVFRIEGHPKAKRCYAWSFREKGEDQFVAVLEIPPVTSPNKAVQAYIASLKRN